MNKAVYIINKPQSCTDCFLCKDYKCQHLDTMILEEVDGVRPFLPECPLKALPEKNPCNYYDFEKYQSGYDKGWNDFYDKIVGE